MGGLMKGSSFKLRPPLLNGSRQSRIGMIFKDFEQICIQTTQGLQGFGPLLSVDQLARLKDVV